jgi:hypothetical protein
MTFLRNKECDVEPTEALLQTARANPTRQIRNPNGFGDLASSCPGPPLFFQFFGGKVDTGD